MEPRLFNHADSGYFTDNSLRFLRLTRDKGAAIQIGETATYSRKPVVRLEEHSPDELVHDKRPHVD